MLNSSWFGSKSSSASRHSQPRQTLASAQTPDVAQSGPSDASSVSPSSRGPSQTPCTLTSSSDVPLDEVHAHIDDPAVYAPTPSLIHSTEKAAATLKTSLSWDQRDGAQNLAFDGLQGTLFTPQDAVIAEVFGRSLAPRTVSPPPSHAPRPSLMTTDSLPPPPTLTVYDPFSGTKLGETPMSPINATMGKLPAFPTVDDRTLWSSLERILELQAEIATMHADMESVGGRGGGNIHTSGMGRTEAGSGFGAGAGMGAGAGSAGAGMGKGSNSGPRKRARKGQTLPVSDEEPEPEGGATSGAVSEISIDHSDDQDDNDDDDDDDDIHGYGKRRRDEEFARLAEQFAQRKVAIGGIMNKLDDLSTALKTFHALPIPPLDLATSASRTNTMSSTTSNISAPSSPPLNVYPVQPPSPLSSVAPSQAGIFLTRPGVSLSPPIPPA